ncbi:MAG: hypothetical protein RIQ88_372 [Actinomycetota bacterium]
MILGWFFLLLGLAISIGLHELGHLFPAKKFGVKVTKYMIGFGPTIFSRKRGETEYGVKAIPLGGYIQMIGMIPPANTDVKKSAWSRFSLTVRPADENDEAEDERAFYKLKPWQKLIVMFGGPFANLLIALVLTLVLFCGFGSYERSTTVAEVVTCVPSDSNPNCDKIGSPDSPAKLAGLKAGDKIQSFAGVKLNRWGDIEAVLADSLNKTVSLTVLRDGEEITLTIKPTLVQLQNQSRAYLGLRLEEVRVRQTPIAALQGLGAMLYGTGEMIVQLPIQAVQAVTQIAPGAERDTNGAISIVGLGQFSGEVTSSSSLSLEDKLLSQLGMMLSLNVALFVFNMIPLVPLDGGHIAGAIYESGKRRVWKLRGKTWTKPVDTGLMMPVAYFVASLLLLLTVVLILRDILNPIHF